MHHQHKHLAKFGLDTDLRKRIKTVYLSFYDELLLRDRATVDFSMHTSLMVGVCLVITACQTVEYSCAWGTNEPGFEILFLALFCGSRLSKNVHCSPCFFSQPPYDGWLFICLECGLLEHLLKCMIFEVVERCVNYIVSNIIQALVLVLS